MILQDFSTACLQVTLQNLKSIPKKIQFLTGEISRCEKAIEEINNEAGNYNLDTLKIVDSQGAEKSFITLLLGSNRNLTRQLTRKIVKETVKDICTKYREYILTSENILEHLSRELDPGNGDKTSTDSKENNAGEIKKGRIIWLGSEKELISIFSSLQKNESMPAYSNDEIFIHFSNQKGIPFPSRFSQPGKLLWFDSDNAFSVFLHELVCRGMIRDEEKYKVVAKHFLNNRREPFKSLPQKKHYTETCTRTGNMIKLVLDEAGIAAGEN